MLALILDTYSEKKFKRKKVPQVFHILLMCRSFLTQKFGFNLSLCVHIGSSAYCSNCLETHEIEL